jgi:glycosyltransferase involved in cell wall biosynthesis
MNICFVSKEYPPETHAGGIGTYTYNMATTLSALGHAVHVVTSSPNRAFTTCDQGVWIHRIKSTRIIRPRELHLLFHSYLVSKKISRINCVFDIVQASEFANEAFWFTLNKKAPLITRLATPHFLIEELNGKVHLGPRPLFNWMEKRQTLSSNGIFSSTRALARIVSERWRVDSTRMDIIPNSLNLSRILHLGSDIPLPEILRNNDYLLYFGRLEERKGVHVLAQALQTVFEQFPHLVMVFVGADSTYRGCSMKQFIASYLGQYSGKVIFFDNMSQRDLFPIVKSARMVILPSLWEAFGFVCVEAMALGRPVIATSGSGFEEIIEDNVTGYLVEPGNIELLAAKITSKLHNEDDLARVAENAKRRAKDFDVSKIAHQLLAYYKRILDTISTQTGNTN